MNNSPANITWHDQAVSRSNRERSNNHKAIVLWFTGLSGSGKSTIANRVEQKLFELQRHTYLLDGDNVRHGLNRDLGFGEEDRTENIRRIGEVSKLMADAGLIVLCAFVSPYQRDRKLVREMMGAGRFVEVYVKASLATCEGRDPKGLYKKARCGEIVGFTGVDAPYEEPKNAELVLDSDDKGVEELADEVVGYLDRINGIFLGCVEE